MELLLKLTEEKPVPVVEYDPGELPCGLLAQYWYALLAQEAV